MEVLLIVCLQKFIVFTDKSNIQNSEFKIRGAYVVRAAKDGRPKPKIAIVTDRQTDGRTGKVRY